MHRTLVAAALISLIVGIGVGYIFSYGESLWIQSEIGRLESEISTLRTELDKLNVAYEQLEADYHNLNNSYTELQRYNKELEEAYEQVEEAYEQLAKYFFIGDSNLTTSLDENDSWDVEHWHPNADSISEIENGILHLFYNETDHDWYGNSGVYQGRHPDENEENTTQLLVGRTQETANFSDYVIFPKSMLSDKFQLRTRFRILNMGFNYYPSEEFFDPTHARVNVGITLMCALNDNPYSVEAQTLWLDIYFAGYSVDETHIWFIPENTSYTAYHDDVHAGYFVGEVPSSDFGEWITMSIDLGDYISKTLNLITEIDVETIRVYGFIVFVECLGAYAEVEYDYVETYQT